MYDYTRDMILKIIAQPFKAVITFLFIMLFLIILSGCKSTHEPFHFRKVIGITHSGDTVLIDVNSLRPRIYNTYQYNNTIPYYNTLPYSPQIIIRPSRPVFKPVSPVLSPILPKPVIKPGSVIPPLKKD